jgi:hypothetical protein
MAQLGDLVRATVLLRSAAGAVGPKAGLARARSRPAISLRRALSLPSPIYVANSLIASYRRAGYGGARPRLSATSTRWRELWALSLKAADLAQTGRRRAASDDPGSREPGLATVPRTASLRRRCRVSVARSRGRHR